MITDQEQQKEISATQNYRWQPISVDGLRMMRLTGYLGHYNRETWIKRRIVLHYTAGTLAGDIMTLITPSKVSVAYVIGRSGMIYNLFPDIFWAYHLGKTAIGGNTPMSAHSVGIEITNFGWLQERQGIMYTYGNSPYCRVEDERLYIRTTPFRGKEIWATFTAAQYASLKLLLQHLTTRFKIPYTFLPENERLDVSIKATTDEGIFTHTNYRDRNQYGNWDKWDIGPAFDFTQIAP